MQVSEGGKKKKKRATWSYFLDVNNKSHVIKTLSSSSTIDLLSGSASLCWTHFICKMETQLFFSLEMSLLTQLTTWALITAQRRERSLLLKQHRLSSAPGNCETVSSGPGKETSFLDKHFFIHQSLTYWEHTNIRSSFFPHPRSMLRVRATCYT